MAEARNSRIAGIAFLLFAFSLVALPAHAKYGGGTGEPNDPYLIYTPEHMNAIGTDPNDWDKHFKLMTDIDLAGLGENGFNLIGTDPNHPFRGTLDGNGHTISSFAYVVRRSRTVGLFGCVSDPHAVIRNLTLLAPRVSAVWGEKGGALIGEFREGTLFNCHAEGVTIEGLWENVGGLVGASGVAYSAHMGQQTTIQNCSCSGRVPAFSVAGGLVGHDWNGSFYECFAACEVSGGGWVGGLVGYGIGTRLVNCYTRSNVKSDTYAGGLLGGSSFVDVIDCYSVGRVTGTGCVGGFIGTQEATYITASFWDASINDQLKDAGAIGPLTDPQSNGPQNYPNPIGRTTAQMQDPNMFRGAGWDFLGEADGPSDTWAEPPGGGYPILWWQLTELAKLPFAGGTGRPDDPYLIATGEQLNSIGCNPRLMAAHFRVTNDIDLSGLHLYLIGNEKRPFEGVFDGGNFAIANFTYVATEAQYVGLFRMIFANGAEVRNLRLVNPAVDGANTRSVGSLVGLLQRGSLRNCHVEGGRISGDVNVGGLTGENGSFNLETGTIQAQLVHCSANTTVVGRSGVGGLVGTNDNAVKVADCQANSDVQGDASVGGLVGANNDGAVVVNSRSGGSTLGRLSVGGLVGFNPRGIVQRSFSTAKVQGDKETGGLVGFNFGTITDCYAAATVSGKAKVGGLVGRNGSIGHTDYPGMLSNSYSVCHVSGTQDVGGLIGYNAVGSVTACLWDATVSGLPTRIVGPVAKTTAQMQTASTFLDAGWDFVGETANGTEDIWWILEGQDYPRLSWERSETP